MTTSNQTPHSAASTDPRPRLLAAAHQITPYVDRAAPADLDRPTPCSDWVVRDLLAHLVAVERRIAHIVHGGHPFDLPAQVADVADSDWTSAHTAALGAVEEALAEPGVLERTVAHPAGMLPAPLALSIYVSELTTHGWDLATALGDASGLDESLAEESVEAVRQILPAEPRGTEQIPFGPVVAVPEDASAYDRLLGWYGRDPRWSAQAR